MRILVAEDERSLASFLQKALGAESHAVDVAYDGEEAQSLAREHDYDLLIIDLSLPRVEGLQVIRNVRSAKPNLPIIIVTGRALVEDRIRGLDSGADDYLIKPFSVSELSARIRAIMRRGTRQPDSTLRVEDLELDRVSRSVRRGGRGIEMTAKEFALLEYLMRNAGRPVTRAMITEHVWNISFDTLTNVVDVYISYLRKKVDNGTGPRLIRTVRGVGYMLAANHFGKE